jgi:transposase-like protein
VKSKAIRAEAIRLYAARELSVESIAARFQVHAATVLVWVRGAGVDRRNKPTVPRGESDRKEFARLYCETNLTWEEIAEQIGVAKGTLIRWRAAARLKRRTDKNLHLRGFKSTKSQEAMRRLARLMARKIVHAKRSINSKWLGCDLRFVRCYGAVWHLDHVVPLACFDLTKERDRKKALHFTNLHPLWADTNRNKKDQIYRQQSLAL